MYNDHIYAIGLIITDSISDNLFIYLIYLFIFFLLGGGGITLYKYTDAEVCSFLYTTQKLLSIVIGIVVTYQFL